MLLLRYPLNQRSRNMCWISIRMYFDMSKWSVNSGSGIGCYMCEVSSSTG